MSLKTFTIPSNVLATSIQCRMDGKYAIFTNVDQRSIFSSQYEQLPLSRFLTELPIKKLKKGELDDEYLLVNISDQDQRSGTLEGVELVSEIGSDKTILNDADIFISKLGMPKGYLFLNKHKSENIIGSTEFIPYTLKNPEYELLIKYILLHPRALQAYSYIESGKTPSHKRVNPYEFLKIKIPLIPLATQNEIVSQIKPIEDKITSLRDSIIPAQEIINRIFAREFGFDENLHHEFGKGMTASTQQADDKTMRIFSIPSHELARSSIVRNSTRFHNPPTKKLMDLLDSMDTLYVNDVLSEDIHRGASPKYDQDGTIPVVKTGHLKNGHIEISTDEFVHEDFYKSSTRSQVRQGDILIASTGKGSLGKIDLLEDEQDLVADGHISIVRIDETKYNKKFFVYFFRSILGYFQIERDFTGATNQIELYADEISQFKIPSISLTKQQHIVDEITAELNAQTSITDAIAHERAKIDQIIEQAIV